MAKWGIAALLLGFGGAIYLRIIGVSTNYSIWTSAAALTVMLAYAVLRDSARGAWMSTLCAGFLAVLCIDAAHLSNVEQSDAFSRIVLEFIGS